MVKWASFEGKTVLVTGASSGIGLSMVHEFAQRKANVVLVARSRDILEEVAISVREKGVQATVIPMDLGVSTAAKELFDIVISKGLEIDLLVNNAGYGRWGKFTDFDRSDYNSMIQLNINTLTELCHLFITDMIKRKSGGIINVASTAAFGPVPYANVYSATKAFVLSFSEALNFEYRDQGIHVMALCPGATESKFLQKATEKSAAIASNASERSSSMRYMTSEAVAKKCLDAFLKGKIYRITGSDNRIMYAISKHLSRKTMLNVVGKMFGGLVNQNN
jgi:short-subunit dehydrogenase